MHTHQRRSIYIDGRDQGRNVDNLARVGILYLTYEIAHFDANKLGYNWSEDHIGCYHVYICMVCSSCLGHLWETDYKLSSYLIFEKFYRSRPEAWIMEEAQSPRITSQITVC